MPDQQQRIGIEGQNRERCFQNDTKCCCEVISRGRAYSDTAKHRSLQLDVNSLSDTAVHRRANTNTVYSFEVKKTRKMKNVSFNMDLNEYFEPKQNSLNPGVCSFDCLKERRNAVSMIKRDSYEVLRILSMYTSWRLAQTQKGRKYEQFSDFLGRASPKLFDKFFVDSHPLL